jgi:hypothetical protein
MLIPSSSEPASLKSIINQFTYTKAFVVELVKEVLPLVGVLIGAILSGIGAWFRARLERKRTIALALADLLEVRHHICGIEVVLKELRKRFSVPAEAAFVLQALIEKISPVGADVHKRYDNAVSLLAGIDPVLAFSLRSKNTLPNLLGSLRGAAQSAGLSIEAINQVESTLRLSLAPRLDKAAIELAGKHSFFTKRKVVKLIAKSEELPSEITTILDQVTKLAVLEGQKQAA